MGFRFQKRINLGGGVRLNLSKSGVGVSAGVKGARVGIGPKGSRTTLSVPGTGLSYVKESKGTRASSGDGIGGGLVVAGLGLWLVAEVWIYLLAFGGAMLGVAAVWFVTKHQLASVKKPSLSTVTPTEALGLHPQMTYEAIVNVDPTVFEDSKRTESAALNVFSAWAQKLPKSPANPEKQVQALQMYSNRVAMLETQYVVRDVVWRANPYGGRKKLVSSPVDPDSVSPWTVEQEELAESSRHFAACQACMGEGKVFCVSCDATGRVACLDCEGRGKQVGEDAGGRIRELNCKSCRGRGDKKCPGCTKGKNKCQVCEGKKKVDRWLVVEERTVYDTQFEPDGKVTRAFSWGQDGCHATAEQIGRDARIIFREESRELLSSELLEGHVPEEWVSNHWAALHSPQPSNAKLVGQALTLAEIPTIEVIYSLGGDKAQAIDLEGLRMLAPPREVDELFYERANRLVKLPLVLSLIPVGLGITYAARGTFYRGDALWGMLGLVVLACVGAYFLFASATLGRRTAKPWLVAVLAPLLGAALVGVQMEPTKEEVHGLIGSHNFVAAEEELEALHVDHADPLYQELQAEQALSSQDWKEASKYLRGVHEDHEMYKHTRHHVVALTLLAARTAIAASSSEDAQEILAESILEGNHERNELMGQIVVGKAALCAKAGDWDCAYKFNEQAQSLGSADSGTQLTTIESLQLAAVQRDVEAALEEADLEVRSTKMMAALTMIAGAQRLNPPDELRISLVRRQKRDARALSKLNAKKERARRKLEAKRERAQKKAERRERVERRRNSPLQCCDGSVSPSCTCGGSRSGCCSRHGGVCGCSAD